MYAHKEFTMPQYVIEREVPGVGKLSPAELKALSQKSWASSVTSGLKSSGCTVM